MRPRWSRPLAILVLLTLLLQALISAPPAMALSGVFHNPYGIDELYSTEATERAPRDPMAGDSVYLKATTWPIEAGQSVWITWTKNGVSQTPIGAAWQYNNGNNSYWQISMGSFVRGDQISYTVRADVNGSGQISTGPFSFKVTSWSSVTNVASYTNNSTSVDVTTGDSAGSFTPKIRFAFPTVDSFRLQLAPSGSGLNISGLSSYTVGNTASTLTISTTALVLKIQKTPYRLAVYKGDGTTLITRQYDPGSFRNLGWASDGSTTITRIEDHYLSPAGERFSGFGERYDYLDQRGHDVHNYVYNQYRDQGSNHRTYLSVPFFSNSAGYGIYIPSTRYAIFNIGTSLSDMAGFTVDTGGSLSSTLDYYFFSGSPKEILDDYTSVTGRPQLPPKWAFGLWMSANEWNTQTEVNNEIANTSTYNIPHTALVLEQWSDEATFYIWHGATYTAKAGNLAHSYSDFTFPGGTAWSNPQSMITNAHNNGLKVVLWQIPVFKENFDTNPSSAPQQHLNDKSYAQSQGYVVGNGSGGVYRIPTGQWFGDAMVPDFTSSAATNWWMSKRDYLFDIGIDGFKTDGSEAIFGRNVTFADGRKGDEMHNGYPNSYTGAYNSYVASQTGGSGVIFSRAGTSGAQTRSIFWAGDQNSSFDAFQEAVRAGISAGQSGLPYWAWDMAGFTGSFPSAELYLRAAAMSTFSPVMQYHSEQSNPGTSEARTPWNVQTRSGNSNVVPFFRTFANVRMNLLPYIYTEAKRSADTGVPMMRAMSLDFPQDPDAAALDQQYMFGEQLLVAPVTTASATTRDVYIPAGEWYDFWNSGRFTGPGTKSYGVSSLSTIPVYVRPGAIIPLNLNADYALGGNISNSVSSYTNLTFRIYPHGSSSYGYYDDAANVQRTFTSSADWLSHQVTVGVPAITTTSTLQVIATKPSSVTRNATTLTAYSTLAALKAASEGWYWDPVLQATLVKLPSSGSSRTVVLNGVNKAAYEAEFASADGTANNTNHTGYTGTGFADSFDTLGEGLNFSASADSSGTYQLQFRYANATGSAATRTISVDGVSAGTLTLPSLANWDTWGTATLTATLGQGTHNIRIGYNTGNAQAINVDNLTLDLRDASESERVKFSSGSNYLVVEVLDDDLFHFELSPNGPGPSVDDPLAVTPQVAKTDYQGPSVLTQVGNTLETSQMRAEVDGGTLCVEMYDTTTTPDNLLHEICPLNLSQAWKGLTISKEDMQNSYGLGQQFFTGGSSDGDWDGRVRSPGGTYGNAMVYDGDNGPVGNVQIPILFAVGPSNANYGLFLDHLYKQEWTLNSSPWKVETWGDQLRWYVMGGPDLPDLRKDYMELTGRPPVPPKKALGLWVSEYSYDDWDEIDDTLSDLRANKFPVDGFMLDLEWFGGVTQGSDSSSMGTLDWDSTNFPNPATKIGTYKSSEGIGLMAIEESYIAKNLGEHSDMQGRGYLVRDGCSSCSPVYLTSNDWWGRGGMIDWTQDGAGDYWHDSKRQPLIDDGLIGHWLDLGEPEMYDPDDWVSGVLPGKHAHADYHNAYGLKWAQSLARGYTRNGVQQRPFALARSAAAGIQRFGVAMWSADIGAKLTALGAQENAQMHMSMSGIDYYGSDIGGFRREMLNSDLNELYTQWFASSMWLDIPGRPHVDNLCNCRETAPDQVGDLGSNLANVRQRYELTPYYYSLAHRANLYGEPIAPPLVYYYQNDSNVREIGHEKLVGRDILVGIVAGAGERQRNMYLPAGKWVDYYSGQWYSSSGQWYNNLPLYVNGSFRLPAFARAGAIIPKMFVDDKTMNVMGKRTDSSTRDELIVRVYPDTTASSFTLYEDDGETIAYQTGGLRTTALSQQLSGSSATVTIAASSGTYSGAPSSRVNVVELVAENSQASAVTLGGSALTQYNNKAAFDAASSGWYNAGGNLIVAKSTSLSVSSAKTFVFTLGQTPVSMNFSCSNGTTVSGQSVYVVGSVPQLGMWSPASAVKLTASSYPTWTGTISYLPPNTSVTWKCIKRVEANYPNTADQWEADPNNSFTTPGSGSGGSASGGF